MLLQLHIILWRQAVQVMLSDEALAHILKKGGRAVVDLVWCNS
jgi:hypothetical protein